MDNDIRLRLALMEQMPMYFNALVIENTSRCTAKCAMCYQSAGPQGSDVLGKAALTVDEVARVIGDAAGIANLQPRLHLTGGEAFMRIAAVYELLQVARSSGFLDLTTTTNAFWARDAEQADAICERLRACGLTTMEISWDFWHMPFIPPEAVSNCLDACWKAGIESNLRLLSSRSHTAQEALAVLRPLSVERASRVSCGPVFPTGRAAHALERADLYNQGTLNDTCHSYLNLTVNAAGKVFPCCAGIDQTDNFVFGNIREQSIVAIARSLDRSPMLRTIVFGGVAALIPILREAGIKMDASYNSICHMCWSVFSRPECTNALRAYFDDLQQRALLRAVAHLEQRVAHGS